MTGGNKATACLTLGSWTRISGEKCHKDCSPSIMLQQRNLKRICIALINEESIEEILQEQKWPSHLKKDTSRIEAGTDHAYGNDPPIQAYCTCQLKSFSIQIDVSLKDSIED